MYIARKNDGSLDIIENLNEKNPDPELLRNVKEIYVITKTLIPVMTLKPKPKEEQEAIIKAAAAQAAPPDAKPKKTKNKP